MLLLRQGVLLSVRGWQSLECCEICREMLCQARCASYKDEQGTQEHSHAVRVCPNRISEPIFPNVGIIALHFCDGA